MSKESESETGERKAGYYWLECYYDCPFWEIVHFDGEHWTLAGNETKKLESDLMGTLRERIDRDEWEASRAGGQSVCPECGIDLDRPWRLSNPYPVDCDLCWERNSEAGADPGTIRFEILNSLQVTRVPLEELPRTPSYLDTDRAIHVECFGVSHTVVHGLSSRPDVVGVIAGESIAKQAPKTLGRIEEEWLIGAVASAVVQFIRAEEANGQGGENDV